MIGLSQSKPTSRAGKGGHFLQNHMTEYGSAGDPQRNGAATGEMGKMEAGRAGHRCPVIEHAIFSGSVILHCLIHLLILCATFKDLLKYPYLPNTTPVSSFGESRLPLLIPPSTVLTSPFYLLTIP